MRKNSRPVNFKTFDYLHSLGRGLPSAVEKLKQRELMQTPHVQDCTLRCLEALKASEKASLIARNYLLENPTKRLGTLRSLCRRYGKGQQRYHFCLSLASELYESVLGTYPDVKVSADEALMLLNREIPRGVDAIEFVLPVVPVRSPFTIYIAAMVNEVATQVCAHNYRHRDRQAVSLQISYVWNPHVYPKIIDQTRSHFDFDKSLSYDKLRESIEFGYCSFINRAILTSEWPHEPKTKQQKISLLTGASTETGSAIWEKMEKFFGNRFALRESIAQMERDYEHLHESILKQLKPYLSDRKPASLLLFYLGDLIRRSQGLGTDKLVILLTPLPFGIVLDHMLSHLKKVQRPENGEQLQGLRIQNCRILSYVPFPFERGLPFYVTPYSFACYKPEEYPFRRVLGRRKRQRIQRHTEVVRRLLIAAAKKLGAESVELPDTTSFPQLVKSVTDVFRFTEKEVQDYFKYV